MPLNQPLFTLGLVVVSFFGSLLLARLIVRVSVGRMDRRFPAVLPAPDAVTRRFQSFRLGNVNAGLSIHVSVDQSHLHLTPLAFLRLFGVRAMSIPWEAIEIKSLGRWMTTVKIAGVNVRGPSWCLQLAEQNSVGSI